MSTTNTFVRPRILKKPPIITLTGSADAIDFSRGDNFVLNRSGAANATTLADPSTADDGRIIWISNGTTQANTITVASGLGGSGGSYDVLTMLAVVAANVSLRAYNGYWYMVSQYGITVS